MMNLIVAFRREVGRLLGSGSVRAKAPYRRRADLVLAAVVLAGSALSAPSPASADPLRFAIVTHGSGDAYWSTVRLGVDAAALQMNVSVTYQAPPTFDMGVMAKMIEAATATHPDGLIVSIPDPDALGPAIKQAVAAGIPVLAIDSGINEARPLGAMMFMGEEEYEAGVAAGKRMKAAGITSALCLNHEVGNADLDHRCEGFAKGFAGRVEVLAINQDPTESRNRILSALTTHKDVDGMLALGADAAAAMLQTLDAPGVRGRMKGVGTFDLSPQILQSVSDGKLLFGIDEQPYLLGYLPIVFMKLYHDYKLMPAADVNTGPNFVTQADAKAVLDLARKGLR